MLLLGVLFLAFARAEEDEKITLESLQKVRLTHDMRTFANATVDWSSKLYPRKSGLAIPKCHEQRIIQSFFVLHEEWLNKQQPMSDQILNDIRDGHLVFPVVITVSGEPGGLEMFPPQQSKGHFVLVHSFHKYKYSVMANEHMHKLYVRIASVSEEMWETIWNRWDVAVHNGLDLCNGTDVFEDVIPGILANGSNMDNFYNRNYTEITSDLCNHTGCVRARNSEMTLTMAYPNKHGMRRFVLAATLWAGAVNRTEPADLAKSTLWYLQSSTRASDMDMRSQIAEAYGGKPSEKREKGKCVFTPPYC